MNQWMDDLKHTCGFVYSFCLTCKKGSVKVQHWKSALYLVWTKASELADFPGVNTTSEFQSRFRVDKTKQIKPG